MMYKLSKKHPQKRAFITGAASGLGRALSCELAKDGWTIGISDINMEELAETAELVFGLGGKTIQYELDVADKTAYAEVVEKYLAAVKGIDFLVNNAGVGDGANFEEYGLENWEWMVGINQMGVIHGCHYFIPRMKQQQSGHILNISSMASFGLTPRMGPYNATKAAVKAISETLYSELMQDKIEVSVAMPFFFKTKVMQYARGDAETQEMGKMIVESAEITAEDMAGRLLRKCGRRKLYIVEPFSGRMLFIFHRFFPTLFRKINGRMEKYKDNVQGRVKKKYDRYLEKSGKQHK